MVSFVTQKQTSLKSSGRYSGTTSSSITCKSVKHACMQDGLIYKGTIFPTGQPKTGHYVALFIWPQKDYHWIRKVPAVLSQFCQYLFFM